MDGSFEFEYLVASACAAGRTDDKWLRRARIVLDAVKFNRRVFHHEEWHVDVGEERVVYQARIFPNRLEITEDWQDIGVFPPISAQHVVRTMPIGKAPCWLDDLEMAKSELKDFIHEVSNNGQATP